MSTAPKKEKVKRKREKTEAEEKKTFRLKETAGDPLAVFMKAKGVETRQHWDTLKSFADSDLKLSERVLRDDKSKEIIVCSSPLHSLHSFVVLLASKYASGKESMGSLCIHENLNVANAFIQRTCSFFPGIKFVSSVPQSKMKINVVCTIGFDKDAIITVSEKTMIIIHGSEVFASRVFQSLKREHNVVVCVHLPVYLKLFDMSRAMFSEPNTKTDLEIVNLSPALRALVNAIESGFDEGCGALSKRNLLYPSLCSFRMISLECLSHSIRSLQPSSADVDALTKLTSLFVAKAFVALIGDEMVSTAMKYLDISFDHPVYGDWMREVFSSIRSKAESYVAIPSERLNRIVDEWKEPRCFLVVCTNDNEVSDVLNQEKQFLSFEQQKSSGVFVTSRQHIIKDPVFEWTRFDKIFVLGSGQCEIVELARFANVSSRLTILITDYECQRGTILISHRQKQKLDAGGDLMEQLLIPSSWNEIKMCFSVDFDWKSMMGNPGGHFDGLNVFVSQQLLKNSPNLASSLTTSLGLNLIRRRNMVCADVVLDESRCIDVQDIQNSSVKFILTQVLRSSLTFEECLLILRYNHPMQHVVCTKVYDVISRISKVCGKRMKVSICLSDHNMDETVELRCISSFLERSQTQSTLKLIGGGWSSREWMMEKESFHESLLTSFPSLSPITAQILLSQFSLTEIFRKPRAAILNVVCKIIPMRMLVDFFEFLQIKTKQGKRAKLLEEYPSSYGFETRRNEELVYVPSKSGQTKLRWTSKK